MFLRYLGSICIESRIPNAIRANRWMHPTHAESPWPATEFRALLYTVDTHSYCLYKGGYPKVDLSIVTIRAVITSTTI